MAAPIWVSSSKRLARRMRSAAVAAVTLFALAAACSTSQDGDDDDNGSSGSGNGTGSSGSGGQSAVGGAFGVGASQGVAATSGNSGSGGGAVDGCTGLAHEQETIGGPLDIYLVFDRTSSMGQDCEFEANGSPPTSSKACFATYALPEYLMNVDANADTRLAFQFMSLAEAPTGCDGAPYATPLIEMTPLPIDADHAIIQAISDETFRGGFGTQIEGGLRGIAQFTAANQTQGRQMIGVLMTDGEPNGCEDDIGALADIIGEHYAQTGIRTFIIGMEGASNDSLEQYAAAGGAEPHDDFCGDGPTPCHYWNVGDGSGDAIASALQAIVRQVVPLPCTYEVAGLEPPPGERLDFAKVNVVLTDEGGDTTIGQVPNEAACPSDQPAWYYDDPSAPTNIVLCQNACSLVTGSSAGATVRVVVGCTATMIVE